MELKELTELVGGLAYSLESTIQLMRLALIEQQKENEELKRRLSILECSVHILRRQAAYDEKIK